MRRQNISCRRRWRRSCGARFYCHSVTVFRTGGGGDGALDHYCIPLQCHSNWSRCVLNFSRGHQVICGAWRRKARDRELHTTTTRDVSSTHHASCCRSQRRDCSRGSPAPARTLATPRFLGPSEYVTLVEADDPTKKRVGTVTAVDFDRQHGTAKLGKHQLSGGWQRGQGKLVVTRRASSAS